MKQKTEERFRNLMRKIDMLNNISQTLSWDMRVMMPPSAAPYRSEEMGYLAQRLHVLQTSDETEELLLSLEADPPQDPVLRAAMKASRRTFDQLRNVPGDLLAVRKEGDAHFVSYRRSPL